MIYRTLKFSELLSREGDSAADQEILRRVRSDEVIAESIAEEIKDYHYGRGMDDATPDAIDFIYNLMDGEYWRENLDEDTRDWIKTDLLMLLEHPLEENHELEHS